MNNLKARLQRAGTPRRESPGVGAGAEEPVTKFDDSMGMILEFLVRTKWLSVTGLLTYKGEEIVDSCNIGAVDLTMSSLIPWTLLSFKTSRAFFTLM